MCGERDIIHRPTKAVTSKRKAC